MQKQGSTIYLSPRDLAGHLSCRHLTQLDRAVVEGRQASPQRHDPFLEMLIRRGDEHEKAYVERLRHQGLAVVDLTSAPPLDTDATRRAIASAADVIVQAPLAANRWAGRVDVLLRVPDGGNPYDYEPVDTKLSTHTRAESVLQLCAYSELIRDIQGRLPKQFHVVTPSGQESYRTLDYLAYARFVRARLDTSLTQTSETYPDPVPHCEICRWSSACNQLRRADDHLSLVAGIRATHRKELSRQGIVRVSALASMADLPEDPLVGTVDVFRRLQQQARLQVAARTLAVPPHEMLPVIEGRGLCRLPEPAGGDVFLDFEGDPFLSGGGREYLTGWAWQDAGNWNYEHAFAFTAKDEKAAFERLMSFLEAQWHADAGFHIYHYAAYEPTALKRLASRHNVRAEFLDRLLRGGRFIDLHAVVCEALRAGIERYGLKELEPIFAFERLVSLDEAGNSRRAVELALEGGGSATLPGEITACVAGYNREDCLSAAALRTWLEQRRIATIAAGATIPRPVHHDGTASEAVSDRDRRITDLSTAMLRDVPADVEIGDLDSQARAKKLLADLLGYFRREEKCAWWEHFRLRDLDCDALIDEREGIGGLRFESALPMIGRQRVPVQRYRFPEQETAVRVGDKLRAPSVEDSDGLVLGTVAALDLANGVVDIRKTAQTAQLHYSAAFREQVIPASTLENSLLALADDILARGMEASGAQTAGRDLLLRHCARGCERDRTSLRRDSEPTIDAAARLALSLEGGVLPVQGPPGSGKTYTGARVILQLVAAGKRVGITAVSHKVIDNLLLEVRDAARHSCQIVRLIHKNEADNPVQGIEYTTDNIGALQAARSAAVVGGTAWLWSRDDAAGVLDYLVVDEAGQMALAQVLAVSRSATNLILLGDPQQLEQPHQGAHPDGTDIAALVHVVGVGRATVSADAGLFLDKTWRLHPSICRFTSETYYDDRLSVIDGLEVAHQESVWVTLDS